MGKLGQTKSEITGTRLVAEHRSKKGHWGDSLQGVFDGSSLVSRLLVIASVASGLTLLRSLRTMVNSFTRCDEPPSKGHHGSDAKYRGFLYISPFPIKPSLDSLTGKTQPFSSFIDSSAWPTFETCKYEAAVCNASFRETSCRQSVFYEIKTHMQHYLHGHMGRACQLSVCIADAPTGQCLSHGQNAGWQPQCLSYICYSIPYYYGLSCWPKYAVLQGVDSW